MSESMLNADRVEAVFMDCLFKEGEPHDEFVKVEGITQNVGFHPERLKSYDDVVRGMLAELPDPFHKNGGGGWSFFECMQ